MRLALVFAIVFALLGCASQPSTAPIAFDGRPHYPLTVIHLSPSLILRHVAGPPCDHNSTARPLVGTLDSERTYSTYDLVDSRQTKLFTAPSMLSDPKDELKEFQNHYRQYDRITVLTSSSQNTILIIEDRSPAYPTKAYILLRRRPDSSWTWSQVFDVPTFPRSDTPPPQTHFPTVVGLSDIHIWFRAEGKTLAQKLDETTPARPSPL